MRNAQAFTDILRATGLATLTLIVGIALVSNGQTTEITAAEKRQLEAAKQLKAGLKKLKACKTKVRKCNNRGASQDGITCRDIHEGCFERVYIDYPQVEQYE